MFRTLSRSFFSTAKQALKPLDNVTLFSAKKYDIDFFDRFNNKAESSKKLSFTYRPEELNALNAQSVLNSGTVCAFVNDKLDADCLKVLSNNGVQLIALRCAGFNNVDLPVAQKLGLKVVRVPAYSPYAVAEHTMALLLTLNRRIHKAYNRTKEGNFALDGLLGYDLYGKTVGIIGAGKIGQRFASICSGFGMKILYFDIEDVPEMNQYNSQKVDLNTLFKESDVISLHCPLNTHTKYLINQESIELMKPSTIIINTGRGALVDTKACIKALKQKKLRGMAIDVYEQEENIFFREYSDGFLSDDQLSRLLTFDNVLITGHQAFFTEEALNGICGTTINNILEVKNTGKCANEVKV